MKKTLAILATSSIIALAITAVATNSHAFLEKLRKDNSSKKSTQVITMAGQYSGSFKNDIHIGHDKFVVNDMTSIYFVGEGLKDADAFVTNRRVWVAARVMNGKPTATRIVVLPDPNRTQPRSLNRDRTPSETNANVGIANEQGR
jgi:hypothetical protein